MQIKDGRLIRVFLYTLCYLYCAVLIYIVFLARRRNALTFEITNSYVNLVPIKSKYYFLKTTPFLSQAELFNFCSNLVGNIILFIPLPIALGVIFGIRSKTTALVISIFSSIAIELFQFLLGKGVADIDDVILNSIGAAICLIIPKLNRTYL